MDAVRATSLLQAGLKFAVRYLGSLSASESETILAAGLGLMPVTYGQGANWSPTSGGPAANMGTAAGRTDLQHLANAGLPKGCTVWIDLEGVSPSATAADVGAWVNARASVLRSAGWDAGLYVGADSVLNSAELYALVSIDRYWKSLSDVSTPTCGWSLIQLYKTVTIAGTEVDVDAIQYDYQSRLPNMIFA
jgi:hypothetical protein